jgi:SET domain-containing protein
MEWIKRMFVKNSFDGIEIWKSQINKKGVFATKDFKKGDIIIRWDVSHKLSKEEYEKLSKEEKQYVANINNEYIVNQIPAKFVNHSCDANTSVKDYCDIAIRDIKKWEEITANYLEDWILEFECNCWSKNCIKFNK